MAKKLFIPGPVDVSPEVAAKMSEPMISHRSKDLYDLHAHLIESLKRLMYTQNHVITFTSSSTGVWEAAVRNCVQKKVLCVDNGAFASRWFDVAVACGKEADKLEIPWGSTVKPEQLDAALSKGGYDSVTLVHNETSTAAMANLQSLAPVFKSHGVTSLVDCVSSLAGVKIEVDKLGLDVCLSGTQKALAVAPGMAFASVSPKALEISKTQKGKGYYFDFIVHMKYWEKDHQTPATPSIPHMRSLDYQLTKILDVEGAENRFKRHHEMANTARSWAKKHFELFTEEWCASDTVTCVKNTRNADLSALGKELSAKGYQFSNGYGKLKGQAFRIAHMGDRKPEELATYLAAIDDVLKL
ncbi:2-aminoethylphosphonate--pyruvate transaminase [uncultured archaeon]|nr:2-aminoethylphosphonate--pyruvate transaminase [uncultured archaeon]